MLQLIDKNELLAKPLDTANYPSNYVRTAEVISEKDIVKPYLEKLKEKIRKEIDDSNTGWLDCSVQELEYIIDSILEDQYQRISDIKIS